MNIDDAANKPNDQNTTWIAAPSPVGDAAGSCDDDWLGCEALHPLTWLPSPAAASAGAVPTP